ILSPYVWWEGSVAEEERDADADEREGLGEGDTDPHGALELAGQLRLASDPLDRLADDDAHADGRADGCQAVADVGDRAGDVDVDGCENRNRIHGFFLSLRGAGAPRLVFF